MIGAEKYIMLKSIYMLSNKSTWNTVTWIFWFHNCIERGKRRERIPRDRGSCNFKPNYRLLRRALCTVCIIQGGLKKQRSAWLLFFSGILLQGGPIFLNFVLFYYCALNHPRWMLSYNMKLKIDMVGPWGSLSIWLKFQVSPMLPSCHTPKWAYSVQFQYCFITTELWAITQKIFLQWQN